MRALADFVMKGRAQAVFAATLATGSVFLAWVGAAIVALVILRRGLSAGAYVLFWALLPAVVLAYWGDSGPLSALLGTSLLAVVLRLSASWTMTLCAAVLSGLLTGLAIQLFGQGYIQEILHLLSDFVAQMQTQAETGSQAAISLPSATQIIGLLALSNALTVVLCLILSRWWQAVLYNPGGFAQEFQGFRIAPSVTLALLVIAVLVASLGADYRFWALILIVPFIFAGFGLAHAVVAKKQLGGNWLGVFYLCWFVLDPIKLALLIAVVADSWVNIRARLGKAE